MTYIKDGAYRLTGQSRFPRVHHLLAHHTAHGCIHTAVSHRLLRHVELSLRLCHLALRLHPLHVCQRVLVVQLLHPSQGIIRLPHLCLTVGKGVPCLCGIHLGDELPPAHTLPSIHQHTQHRAAARETDRRARLSLHLAHVGSTIHVGSLTDHLRPYPHRSHLPLLLASAARCQQCQHHSRKKCCFFHVLLHFYCYFFVQSNGEKKKHRTKKARPSCSISLIFDAKERRRTNEA